eukprot:3853832-Amphidinium_carterae.1
MAVVQRASRALRCDGQAVMMGMSSSGLACSGAWCGLKHSIDQSIARICRQEHVLNELELVRSCVSMCEGRCRDCQSTGPEPIGMYTSRLGRLDAFKAALDTIPSRKYGGRATELLGL